MPGNCRCIQRTGWAPPAPCCGKCTFASSPSWQTGRGCPSPTSCPKHPANKKECMIEFLDYILNQAVGTNMVLGQLLS